MEMLPFVVAVQQIAATAATAAATTANAATQAAAATTATAVTVKGTSAQIVISVLASYVIEYLKKNPRFAWLTAQSSKELLFAVGLVTSAATSLGVHWSFDSAAGTFMLTGLNSVKYHLFDWAKAWVFQQLAYDGVVSRPSVSQDTLDKLAEAINALRVPPPPTPQKP